MTTVDIYNQLPYSTSHSVFPLLSVCTSAGLSSLPGLVTHIFIPEGPMPFAILPGFSCSLSLTLITGHGNIKRCPKTVVHNVWIETTLGFE